MGRYTVLDDPSVDERVEKDLSLIVSRIKEALPARQIILGGGFGRGEGSVLVDGGHITIVNDYDLFVVLPDDFNVSGLKNLVKSLAREVGVRAVDILPLKAGEVEKGLPATQMNYDLRNGFYHLWGEDLLSLMLLYPAGKVEKGSIRTLLLNRLICAIEAYSVEYETRRPNKEESFFLVNQTSKVVSACVEALLMDAGRYDHSYKNRLSIFREVFPDKAVLSRLNNVATEFKLRPSYEHSIDGPGFWKEAMREYVGVLSELLAKADNAPAKAILSRLCEQGVALTNTPIERVELLLLISRELGFIARQKAMRMAKSELKAIAKSDSATVDWEGLRKTTASLWHELYH